MALRQGRRARRVRRPETKSPRARARHDARARTRLAGGAVMETTMRASIFGFALVLAACGGGGSADEARAPGPAPPADTSPPPAPTNAPPPARTMGTARAMQTTTENLLYDPTFSTLGDSIAFDLYGDGAH